MVRYINKNKKAFTLTEMIIVVAIIVVLAGAGLVGIVVNIRQYQAYKSNLEATGGDNFEADARTAIENILKGSGAYNARTASLQSPTNTPTATPTPTPEGSSAAATATPASDSSAAEATATPTPASSSDSGSGSSTSSGNVSASSIVTSGKGVSQLTTTSSGYSVTVQNDQWNTVSFSLTESSGSYTMTFTGGNRYILDQTVFSELWSHDSYTLNSTQISYLNSTFGLSIG